MVIKAPAKIINGKNGKLLKIINFFILYRYLYSLSSLMYIFYIKNWSVKYMRHYYIRSVCEEKNYWINKILKIKFKTFFIPSKIMNYFKNKINIAEGNMIFDKIFLKYWILDYPNLPDMYSCVDFSLGELNIFLVDPYSAK